MPLARRCGGRGATWGLVAWGVAAWGLAACVAPPDIVGLVRASAGSSAAGSPAAGSAGVGGGSGGTAGGSSELPPLATLDLTGALETHDSTVIEVDGQFTLLHTGPGLVVKTSSDLLTWSEAGSAFAENPAWIAETLPDVTSLWAPDVSFHAGLYHLYYAASTFGTGRSCIGHATATTLEPPTRWSDHGAVICSDLGGNEDDWDAIDPSAFTAPDGARWLVFGSFSSGIKLIPLDAAGRAGEALYALAERPVERAIQAPFLFYRAPYYYLFVSFDWCCRGVSSTYNLRVGRSRDLQGPYVDREGVALLDGGGTLLLAGDERWRGVGANTILSTGGRDYNVYHSYDANAAGRSTLRIAELGWDAADWPISGGP